jgi:hypothetical protein
MCFSGSFTSMKGLLDDCQTYIDVWLLFIIWEMTGRKRTAALLCVPRFSMHTSFVSVAEEGVGSLWGMSGKSECVALRSQKRIPTRTVLMGDFVPRRDVFVFMAFDFIQCNGIDGASLTFERRRSMMETFLSQSATFPSRGDGKPQGTLYVLLTTIRPFIQLGKVISLVHPLPPPPKYTLPRMHMCFEIFKHQCTLISVCVLIYEHCFPMDDVMHDSHNTIDIAVLWCEFPSTK